MRIKTLLFLTLLWINYSCNQSEEVIYLESIDQSGTKLETSSEVPNKVNQVNVNENSEDKDCGDEIVYELLAGQHNDVGEITVTNDQSKIYITYETSGNWWLTETHLFVGEKSALPLTTSGNPKIGHYPYHGDHDHVQSVQFVIDMNSDWQVNENGQFCITISMHASVVLKNSEGIIQQSETAFGKGDQPIEFEGSRWGWYHNLCLNTCENATEDNSSSTGENENNNSGNNDTQDNNQMVHFGFIKNVDKDCFSFQELNKINWGWANEFDFKSMEDPVSQEFPIYIKIEDNCSEINMIEVGKVNMTIFGSNTEYPELVMTYTLTDHYRMKQLEIYVGWINPTLNGELVNSITLEKITLDNTTYTYKKGIIDWPGVKADFELPKFYVISKIIL